VARRIDRAFSPHRCPLAPETQADGLGWYGAAPSVLGFAATWSSALQARCYPSPRPGAKGLWGLKQAAEGTGLHYRRERFVVEDHCETTTARPVFFIAYDPAEAPADRLE
jgi:hypothetical protein